MEILRWTSAIASVIVVLAVVGLVVLATKSWRITKQYYQHWLDLSQETQDLRDELRMVSEALKELETWAREQRAKDPTWKPDGWEEKRIKDYGDYWRERERGRHEES